MRKKLLIVSSMLLVVACLAMLTACNGGENGNLELVVGQRPDYQSIISNESKALIDNALSEDAEEADKKKAAIALFDVANNSRKNTSLSLMLQNSNAGISMGDVIMHGFNLKSGDKWYYQLATQVSTGSNAFDAVITEFAGFLKVAYTNGNGEYYYSMVKGSKSECDCTSETFPYATFVLTETPKRFNEEEFMEELHYLDSMHEINNMKFCEEIIADGVEIDYNSEEGFYRVEFSIDMSADSELVEEWYAMAQKDMQVSGNSIRYYKYYNAVLEVWDNGYAKSYSSDSSREAGMASGSPKDEFTYIWYEDEILSLLREDQSIEMHNLMHSVEDYIEYYSNPATVAARMSGTLVGIIVGATLVGVLIVGGIVAIITVNVLVKKGKLPKLAEKREKKKQKRLAKKQAKLDNANIGDNEGEDLQQ